ncbi:uncharacterized protein F5147DRAFT_773328 [Suillus discolor]|uniref:Uncharacterized protein n=1 Tax=Suillus discolor TaxID=1912936 RepID=A0A9P7F859_9AGAM|nr:uncharacterized protein F5147DRAFT_773328 [Suillus discolor]KAG2108993.1 hypothetical protein F5147DRAFT_773328 [Suillus discolor]
MSHEISEEVLKPHEALRPDIKTLTVSEQPDSSPPFAWYPHFKFITFSGGNVAYSTLNLWQSGTPQLFKLSYFPLASPAHTSIWSNMNMHFHTPPNSTRGSTPDYEGKDELRQHTAGLLHKLEQDSPPALNNMTPSRPPSRNVHTTLKHARSRSLDSTYDSSDDGITEPITPPPILCQLSRFVKRAKTDPKPYQRDVADALGSLFLENQSCPDNSASQGNVELEDDLQQLSPEAVAQAVVTMHAEVEFRCVRALARAHEINATAQCLRLLHMVLEDEGEIYANAALEPLDTSIGEIIKCTKNQTRDDINLGVAAYSREVMSFAAADSQLDHFEGTCYDWDRSSCLSPSGLRFGETDMVLLSIERSKVSG